MGSSALTWAAYKKRRDSGQYDDYEREYDRSLSVVDKDEETRRRYQQYVQGVMASDYQDDIIREQLMAPYYAEEERRRREEERQREQWQREHLAPKTEQVQNGQSVANFDPTAARRKAEPRIRYEQAYDAWNAENPEYKDKTAEEKYNLFAQELEDQNKVAEGTQGYRDWYSRNRKDPEFQRMSDAEKQRQYMMYLDNTARENGTLPEEQRAELSQYKYDHLTDRERQAIDAYMRVEGEEVEEYSNGGAPGSLYNDPTGRGAYSQNRYNEEQQAAESRKAARERTIADVKAELKHLGWTDEQIETELARYKELEDWKITQLGREKMSEIANDPNLKGWERAMVGAGYTAADVLSFIPRAADMAYGYMTDNSAYGRNTFNRHNYLTRMTEEGTSQVRNNMIGDDHPIAQSAYDIGVSWGESMSTKLLGAALGPAGEELALLPFAISASDTAYRDAVNRGFSEKQAEGYAVTVGALEALTEKLPFDMWQDMIKGKNIGRSIITTALAQMGAEAGEEAVNEIGQLMADKISVKVGKTGKTQAQIDIENLMAQGMTEEEAQREWGIQFAKQVGMAALSGAISAAPDVAVGASIRSYRSKYGNNLTQAISDRYKGLKVEGDTAYENKLREDKAKYENNPTQYLADNYKVNSEEDARIKQGLEEIAQKEREGKKLSVSDKSFITENVLANSDQFNQEFLETLYDKGEDSVVPYKYREVKTEVTEDEARTILAHAAESGDAKAFIDAQRKVRNSSIDDVAKRAEEIISDYSGLAQQHGITKEDIGKAILSEKQAYIAGLNGEQIDESLFTNETKTAYNEAKIQALQNKVRTTIDTTDALKTDVTTKNGNTVKLDGVFTSDGKLQTDGGVVGIDDIEIDENKATNKAYVFADNYQSVNVKNNFLNNIKDGQNIENYNTDYGKVYDSALAGLSLENVKKEGFRELDEEQITNIYETAVVERQARAVETFAEAFNGVKGQGKGKAYNESSSTDPKALKIASMLARGSKWDIHLVDVVLDENGNPTDNRGSFVKKDNAIYVRADDFMRALGHEYSHYIETYNKAEYDSLRNAVANFAADKLGSDTFIGLVKHYQGLYHDKAHQNLTAEEISGEMFNDIVPLILESKQGSKALAKYLAENYGAEEARTFGEKIKDVIDNLANSIRKLLSDSDQPTAYAKEMHKYVDELGQYADQFIEALDGAIKNYNKGVQGENAEQSGKVGEERKFSITVDSTDEERYEILKDQTINIPSYKKNPYSKDIDKLQKLSLRNARKAIKILAEKLGVFRDDYKTPDIDVEFEYTKGGLRESLSKQSKVPMDNKMTRFAKMLSCLDDIIENAHLLEVHKDRYIGEAREDRNLRQVYVLVSAFADGNEVVPVKLEIKDFIKGEKDKLYVSIVLPTIEKSSLEADASRTESFEHSEGELISKYNLADILTKVKNNASANDLGKYIPEQFRTEEKKFSLSEDSTGRELSEGQKEYFKNSQIRDKNGNLLVMHHGTASYGFDVFDIKKAKAANLYGRGFYFSKDSSHAGQYGQQYDVYLNIVNPLQPGAKNITKDQLLKFINAVANNEDYGIENYGQGATPQSVLNSVWGKDDFSMLQDINATCIGDFAGAVKEFNRINNTSYDGINTPTETVAFYPNQIKDINNKKPTNADSMRFSLSEEDAKDIKKKAKKSKAVDVTKDLVAVHNLGEQQLIESLKLQGLPSPSIAIIRSGMMHDKYGAISLIFKSDTIDPKNSTRNKVYGGDGWTPTFPAIEVKINRSVAEKIWDKIDSLVSAAEQRSIGYANVDTDNLQDKANRNRGDVVDAYRDNKALQYAFLKDNGIDIDVPSEDVRLDERWTNEQILAVLDIIKDRKQAESLREGYRAYESNPELVEELRQALNQQFRQKYVNKGNAKLFDKDLYEELSFNDFDHLTKGVFKYYREGIQQQMDSQAARAAIQEQIKEHEAEYDKWLRNLFDGIIEKRGLRNNKDVFLPSGNRRSWEALHDDYTLENIVKIMNQQEERGEAAFFSQSAIQALSTKNFKSLDEIRKSKGQLRVETEEEHEKRITEQSEKFTEICNEIMDKSESNSFIAFGRASDAIAEAIRRYRTVQGIDRELRQWRGLNIKSDTAQKIVDLMNEIAENPTGYFEAKPKRAVWLDEIKKAIIPNNVSEDTIKALDDAGIPYEMYRYEDEGQRRDIIAAMEDVKFSLSEDSEGRELSDDQVKYFKNSKAIDAKGRLLELYHGTEAQAFSVFSTPGIWVTPDKELATEYAGEWNNWRNERDDYGHINYETNGMEPEVYGDKYLRMYKVYANVTNPVFLGELNRTLPDDYAGMEFDTLGIKTEEQFDKLYDLVQQHIGDKVWQLTETKEFIDLMKELGYDGMFASENGHRTICVFDSNQLKKVDNLTPTEDKDIRYSISENSDGEPLAEGQQRYFNKSQNLDDEHRLMVMYHGTEQGGFTVFDPEYSDDKTSLFFSDNEDVAKTYIRSVGHRYDANEKRSDKPITTEKEAKEYLESIGYTNVIKDKERPYWSFTDPSGEEKMIRNEYFVDLAEGRRTSTDVIYPVYLNVENPLVIDAHGKKWDNLPEYGNTREAARIAKENGHDGVIIKNVKDYGGGAGFDIEKAKKGSKPSRVVIVFSPEQVKDINNLNPTSSQDIRYALGLEDDWIDFAEELGATPVSSEEKAIDILAKGMEALKNKEVDVPKLRTLALKIRNEFGSSYNANKLAEDLRKAFAYMQTQDHVDYPTMMGILKDIAKPVIEEAGEKVGEEEYKHFIDFFKGKKIKLTEVQKDNVRHAFGSYGAFRNAVMPITISDNGDFTLDQIWEDMVQASGGMLDLDATEGNQPANLLDTLQAMRPYIQNDFGGDTEDMAKDLAMRIVEEYIEGEASKEMHKELTEYRNKLKKDYQERLKGLQGRVNAEARARNKRRAEEAKERQEARDLRQKIKQNANKLYTWAAKPTEGKSVPHNMMVPVMQFLQAIDFVDPIVTVSEDGKYHIRLFDHMDYVDGHKKFIYRDLVGDTRDDVIKQFNEAIGRGEGTKEQRAWAEKMRGIQDIYNKVLTDKGFDDDTSMDFLTQALDAQGLAEDFNDLLERHEGQADMNNLSSAELKLIDNIISNIFHAVNQQNKAYSQPSVDIVNLAQSTMHDAEGKKIKGRTWLGEKLYKFFRIDNLNPVTFFDLLGKRGHTIYDFLRDGQNVEISDIKQASEFMKGAMGNIDKKEARKWTGNKATIHEVPLSEGTVRLTDGHIMGLYKTIRRTGGMDRIRGGIKIELREKGRKVEQKAIHLTEADIKKLESFLTPEMIAAADSMQKYMAVDCAKQGNETSKKLYGFEKFVDPTYYPYEVDKDTVATNNSSENIPMFTGIERSGFTKQLKEGATNPLVIRDIFDVFTDHVAGMAAYHGYAAPIKDAMRWMNYREREDKDGFVHWNTNKKAINDLTGSYDGVKYVKNLLLDLNKGRKSEYIGDLTSKAIGTVKAAFVGGNARVVSQQWTSYFKALSEVDSKYLLTVNPIRAKKNIKRSQELSPIAWWKSKGYYETNLGQPLKEIVTGIATPAEKAKDLAMAPAGKVDDITWAFLYTAIENEQKDKLKGQKISPEEFRDAVNKRFDQVIDKTQVVDSTLHRSQYMRSPDTLNKLQTAFMAEPIKSYNMILGAYLKGGVVGAGKAITVATAKTTARAVAAWTVSNVLLAATQAVWDTLRHAGDDDDWWEVFEDYYINNFIDDMNPLGLLPILSTISPSLMSLFTGESTYGRSNSRFDLEVADSVVELGRVLVKAINGEGNKTKYGIVMTALKPISQITGIPLYNLTRDIVALYNAAFDNLETTINSRSTKNNEVKKDFVKDVNRERSEDTLDEGIVDALNSGVSIYDLKGAVKSEYKNKYFDAYADGNMEEAQAIAERAARAYARMGMSDEDIDEEINAWQEETITYSLLDKAIASGEGIEEEIRHVQEGKDDDKIIKHIMDRYAETIAYEDTHETESDWRGNVEKALQAIDPTLTFDTANEEAMQKKAEKEAEQAEAAEKKGYKEEFFASVDSKNGTAGRKALDGLKAMGVDAKGAKTMVSTKYHDAWKEAKTLAEKQKARDDWMSAYKLVCNYYGVDYKDLDKTWSDWEKEQ